MIHEHSPPQISQSPTRFQPLKVFSPTLLNPNLSPHQPTPQFFFHPAAIQQSSLLSGGGCIAAFTIAPDLAAKGLIGAKGSRRPSLNKWSDSMSAWLFLVNPSYVVGW